MAVVTIQVDRLKTVRHLVIKFEKNFLRRFTILELLKIAVIGFHFSKFLTIYSLKNLNRNLNLLDEFNKESCFNIYFDDITIKLIKKIRENTIPLGKICYCTVGINTGYIKSEMTSNSKIDKTYHKMLNGKDIGVNTVNWKGEWIKYDHDFIKQFGDKGRTLPPERVFIENKILVQRTKRGLKRKLVCYYDDEKYYNLNRLSNVVLDEDGYNLKYTDNNSDIDFDKNSVLIILKPMSGTYCIILPY